MLFFSPEDEIYFFENEEETVAKYKEYGYISATATKTKELWYEITPNNFTKCSVIGYVLPKKKEWKEVCLVIEIKEDSKRGMIHKDHLKKQQEQVKFGEMTPLFAI